MNVRWLRSNGTLLALLTVAMVTVGLLATLVVRQQHDQATETGQVYLDKAGGGTAPAVPLIPANPPQAAPGDRGVESAPAPQPADTDSAPADRPTAPVNPSSNSVTRSNGSAQPETVAPSGISGHSDSAAAGAEKPADVGPPRDALRPNPPDQSMPPRRPSQPREPARPSKPIEADEPSQPRRPTEPGKTTDHDKPGKAPGESKPGKAPGESKPGKAPGEGKPGNSGGVDNESGQRSQPSQSEPRKSGKPGKPTESAQPPDASDSDGSAVRTRQARKPDALDSTKTPRTVTDADEQTQSEPVVEEGTEGAGSEEQRGVEQSDGHHAHS